MNGKMVRRADKLMFIGVKGTGSEVIFHRMGGFTGLSISKNATEYARKYIDMLFEETDVVGYSPSMSYEFDRYIGDPVHEELVRITDGELMGEDAVLAFVSVDMTTDGTEEGSKEAVMREFAVIPDSEGDSSDAYTYSGTFKVKSEKISGTVISIDEWQTVTFTER